MKKYFLFLSLLLISLQLFSACNQDNDPKPQPEEKVTDIGSGEVNGYKMVWEDTFNDSILDEANRWTVEVNGNGGGNSELQYYRRENIKVGVEPVTGNGCLIITAKKETFNGKTCTSGRLTTSGKMSFKHGKVEARIKLPHTANGLWPAFWMLGADYPTVGWPKSGEIDMLEMGNVNGINRGTQDRYYSGWFHWGESWNGGAYPNWGKDATNPTSIQDDFHLFTLIWDDNYLRLYLDLDKNPNAVPYVEMAINGDRVPGNAAYYFHKKFFVIFNLAIGGNFTQIWDINKITALNQNNNYESRMYIDFVRVYQKGDGTEEFSAKTTTGIAPVRPEQYKISPVPTVDILKINGKNTPANITVFDARGSEIFSENNSSEIKTSGLKSGNYFIRITDTNGSTESHSFIKK